MDIHKNARLTPRGREHMVNMVLGGQTPQAVAAAVGVCPRTVRKWLRRFQEEGLAGLQDRSSRPHRLRQPTPQETIDRIEALRRQRLPGKAIAAETGVSAATVSRILKKLGLNRLSALEPAEPPRRYQRDRPGELIHIDIKKLGKFNRAGHRVTGRRDGHSNRGAGWEFLFVAVDDHARIGFTDLYPDEGQHSAIQFLQNSLAYFNSLGIRIRRVLTDNGGAFRAKTFAHACRALGIKHSFTRPYRPQTNGKAERFIQTALREWAYARAYKTSRQRAEELPLWIHRYNWHRPHGSIGAVPPISTIGLTRNNLLRLHS